MSPSSRLKRLPVSASIIEHFLGAGIKHFRINNPLPNNARIIGIISDYQALPIYHFLVECDDWPALRDGEPIPLVEGLGFVDLRSPEEHE